ncbi:hypothetical protein AB0467_31290 [Streptomyces sp. NPDC052095]
MTILESIRGPHDLKAPNGARLGEPADDLGRTGAALATEHPRNEENGR